MCAVLVPCPQPPALATPAPDRPRYVVDMSVAPPFRTVTGRLTVTFTPNRPVRRLVFRLWPNGPSQLRGGSRLEVSGVRGERPDPTTLVVRRTVPAGAHTTVRLSWGLRMPRDHRDRIARLQDGLRLGTFLPLLAWDDRRGWLTDPPARILAETAATPVADFDLRVHTPKGYRVLASGAPLGGGHFRARAVRDVAVAVGRFRVQTATARGVTVRVASIGRAPRLLDIARRALRELSDRYGAYPWRNYTIVIPPDLQSVGIEYPTLSFVGESRYPRLFVNHETAHQWFYSLVGNDQARDPWLDETLATWAQVRLGAPEPPPLRAVPRAAGKHVGEPMSYWDRHGAWYFYGVYGAGLRALRSLGDDAAVDCALRHYVARRAYSIAQPGDLLDELNRVIPGAERRLRAWGIRR
jgi:Peptidase family M1 domain